MSNNHTSTPIMKTNSHLMKIGRREFAARNMWHNYHKHEAKAGLWPARPSGQLTLRLWKWSSFVTNTKTDKHFIIIYKSSSSYVIFASHWKGFGGNRRYGNDYGSTDGSGGGNFLRLIPYTVWTRNMLWSQKINVNLLSKYQLLVRETEQTQLLCLVDNYY